MPPPRPKGPTTQGLTLLVSADTAAAMRSMKKFGDLLKDVAKATKNLGADADRAGREMEDALKDTTSEAQKAADVF